MPLSPMQGFFFYCVGFYDRSTIMGHFVSSPREREKRDSRGNERERQGRKRNRNESEETEEIETFPHLLADIVIYLCFHSVRKVSG